MVGVLVEDFHENADEILERSFFQLPTIGETPDDGVHVGSGVGDDAGSEFRLRWIDLPEAEGLHPHFRAYIDRVAT